MKDTAIVKIQNSRAYEKPAQDKLNKEIYSLQSKLDAVQRAKNANLTCLEDPNAMIKSIRKEIDTKKKIGIYSKGSSKISDFSY